MKAFVRFKFYRDSIWLIMFYRAFIKFFKIQHVLKIFTRILKCLMAGLVSISSVDS